MKDSEIHGRIQRAVKDHEARLHTTKKGVKAVSKPYSEQFERFWRAYPKRWIKSSGRWVKVGKEEAWLVWQRLHKLEHEHIMVVIKQVPANSATLDAHRWLKHKRFKDYELPKPKFKPSASMPAVEMKKAPGPVDDNESRHRQLAALEKGGG